MAPPIKPAQKPLWKNVTCAELNEKFILWKKMALSPIIAHQKIVWPENIIVTQAPVIPAVVTLIHHPKQIVPSVQPMELRVIPTQQIITDAKNVQPAQAKQHPRTHALNALAAPIQIAHAMFLNKVQRKIKCGNKSWIGFRFSGVKKELMALDSGGFLSASNVRYFCSA